MRPNLFSLSGNFYKGNLHTHSNKSDGILDPQEVCLRYKNAGYDFISLTDHLIGKYDYPIVDTSNYRDESFTTLIGAEVHTGAMSNGELWHMVAVGLPLDFSPPNVWDFNFVEGMETANEAAQRCIDAGAFVTIAHPQWSGITLEDALSIKNAHAVECYNHGSAFQERGDGFAILDSLLNNGRKVNIMATDDAHFKVRDYFGAWVMVKCDENSPTKILESLKLGNYYCSQGPIIEDIVVEKGLVKVVSSPIERLVICGDGTASKYITCDKSEKNEIPFGRCEGSPWIRITIIDKKGNRAWTNPIWL